MFPKQFAIYLIEIHQVVTKKTFTPVVFFFLNDMILHKVAL